MSQPLVVSVNSLASDEPDDVIYSVLSYLQVVIEEGGSTDDVHPACLGVNAVWRLDGEVRNGGFSQFVYNTGWDEDFNELIAATLERIGAHKHAAYFAERRAFVNQPEVSAGLPAYLESEYFGENAFRDALNDDSYYDLGEQLEVLIADWVRDHPDAKPHSIDEMFARAEARVGHTIEREY